MKFTLALSFALLLGAQSAFAAGYCLAIRGNGELAPAHWGAMANLVERMGMPEKQAGGSSATITMMLNEAVSMNPFVVSAKSPEEARLRAALLIKSFEGFAEYLTNTSEWRDFMLVYQRAQTLKNLLWLQNIETVLKEASTWPEDKAGARLHQYIEYLKSNYATGKRLGLINEAGFEPLKLALESLSRGDAIAIKNQLPAAIFYAAELREAIRVFGNFDAETDHNLFFRPGLIDFEQLGQQLGRVATFFSATEASHDELKLWEEFFSLCTGSAAGLTWSELNGTQRDCGKKLNRLIETHLASKPSTNFTQRNAGLAIESYPATSIITGQSYSKTLDWLSRYGTHNAGEPESESGRSAEFGKNFSLVDPNNDVKFGYWGDERKLRSIEARLPKSMDEKSRRFMALGTASWLKILSLSPAEPGLSPVQKFTGINGEDLISAGGWSDLHPVLILEAAGCENIVYLTRRGGESPFAQGVAKRLLGFDRDWKTLKSDEINNRGDEFDQSSMWSLLYNLANPRSSFRNALSRADAVMCTDWNSANIKNGIKDMIRDAYRKSPFYLRPGSNFKHRDLFTPQLNPRDTLAHGTPTYAGCY